MAEIRLPKTEQFLLEWLAKEESSALGECRGDDLDELFRRGFATVTPGRVGVDDGYRRVSLTDAGREALARSKPTKEGE